MITLALDSSSKAASAALLRDGRLVGESYLDCGLTHSQTLLPLADALCHATGIPPRGVDRVAVTMGPGSFTGLRIGMAAAKALAFALGVPCAGVSSLLALAYGLRGGEGLCCAALDARCGQVYYALFRLCAQAPQRLCADSAGPVEEVAARLLAEPGRICLAGDGAGPCRDAFIKAGGDAARAAAAPEHLLLQRASSAAYAAIAEGQWLDDATSLAPCYLRLPQAERERLEKETEAGK